MFNQKKYANVEHFLYEHKENPTKPKVSKRLLGKIALNTYG
jgi:hypothetical protein